MAAVRLTFANCRAINASSKALMKQQMLLLSTRSAAAAGRIPSYFHQPGGGCSSPPLLISPRSETTATTTATIPRVSGSSRRRHHVLGGICCPIDSKNRTSLFDDSGVGVGFGVGSFGNSIINIGSSSSGRKQFISSTSTIVHSPEKMMSTNGDGAASASEAEALTTKPAAVASSSAKVEELFQKIIQLDLVEVHLVTELINEKLGLNMTDKERERMLMGGGAMPGQSSSMSSDENKEKEDEEAKVEKTVFELKLTGFDAKSKIKVIKEVRAITGLGLKETKEMVEGYPKIIKKDIKKDEAEELKTKLESVGATIEIA